jgi:anti-sigma factor RsiW
MTDTAMNDPSFLALVHAEIDGELDPRQRSELARRLLADPKARASYEELRRLCAALESLQAVEPPKELVPKILAALPQISRRQTRRRAASGAAAMAWRYVAVAAAVLIVATVALETARSPRFSGGEAVGTLAAADGTVLDTAPVANSPVSGQVRLYRDRSGGLALELDVTASAPVEAVITGDGHTVTVNGLGQAGTPASTRRIALPGFGTATSRVDVTFLKDGQRVGGAILRAGGH